MITAIQQKRAYPWLYASNGFLSLAYLLVFGSLFPLFCDALRMSKTQIGVVLAILPFSYLVTVFMSGWVARHGPKKIMVVFYFLRYWFVLLIPLAIWFSGRFGTGAAFLWVASLTAIFAVLRSIAETGWASWTLDLIPARSRGTVESYYSVAGYVGAALASLAAFAVMKFWPGFAGYSAAIYLGVAFGFVSVYIVRRLPGGGPQAGELKFRSMAADIGALMRNDRLKAWLKGILLPSAAVSTFSFLPLFLSEKVGFTADMIMIFSICFQAGIMVSAVFWGWSTDRFGSKPVFMTAYAALCLIPFCFVLLPRMESQSAVLTGAVYALLGILFRGALAGTSRYFIVTVMPTVENPIFCSSVNLALQSCVAAACALLCGWLLDLMSAFRFDWRFVHLDNFTVLFLLMLACFVWFLAAFRRAPGDSGIRTGQFVSFFLEGNPLLAFSSIVRYHMAEDETSCLEYTRRLGDSQSRLTVEEILQSAYDPNFNVRYEAVVSMARMPPDGRLIDALALAVRSREPGVSEAACWALGRMGDRRALPVLREMLKSEYALLRSQCARALAKLNDSESVPEIFSAFRKEKNTGIRAGYAAALGRLHRGEALPEIMALLAELGEDRLRGDVALAAARIIGSEHHFVRLWKRSCADFETACAEDLLDLEVKASRLHAVAERLELKIGEAARLFERRDREGGAEAVCGAIGLLPPGAAPGQPLAYFLNECAGQLKARGGRRGDYIILALIALRLAVVAAAYRERRKRSAP